MDWMDFLPRAKPILSHLEPLAQDFVAAGHRLYLVGGVVRDLVFGLQPNTSDLDATTDARPEVIKSLLEPHAATLWTQGERFGTIGASIAGKAVEITTHRTEAYDDRSRKPDVLFGDSLDVDLSRRDFTINAMAISLPDGAFFDPFDGLTHCEQRLLATPIEPDVSFNDDPLRILRAARFIPRFGLTAVPELVKAATGLADRMSVVSQERINAELDRLLAVDNPTLGFDFLVESGVLSTAIPAIDSLEKQRQHQSAQLASQPGSVRARRAGLFWPIYKASGPAAAAEALRRLRWSVQTQRITQSLLEHVESAQIPEPSDADVRRLVVDLGITVVVGEDWPEMLSDLAAVTQAVGEATGTDDGSAFFSHLRVLASASDRLGFQAPFTGQRIMEMLDCSPGQIVGQAKKYLQNQWIASGSRSASEWEELLREWYTRTGPS